MNIPGWHTNRKLLIIESDDWGSVRMSSKEAYRRLEKQKFGIENDPYNKFDALESSEDLINLYDILNKIRDKNNNPACITLNIIMSNPDFERIQDSDFQMYTNIGLEESYNRYSDGALAASTLSEGIRQRYLIPQFHGREHLNVPLWMEALQNGDKAIIAGFKEHVFGLKTELKVGQRKNYMAAFETCEINNTNHIVTALKEGLVLFEDYFKFKSKTLIAPCYIWNDFIEEVSSKAGVTGIQGISYQYLPAREGFKKKLHYTGQKNVYGQRYLVRNAFFEPSLDNNPDVINNCLARINTAFRWGKPAIIGSHRLNYIGSLVESNMKNNLKLLQKLLTEIKKKWPDVEFISSDQLIDIMSFKNSLRVL